MKDKRHRLGAMATLLVGAAALALAGCGQKGGNKAARRAGPDAQSSIPVQTASVQRGTIAATVPVTGSIQALNDVQLSAKTSGRVISVSAREGDLVRAGQLIVQQDAADLQANVRQAQANVVSAVAKLAQAKTNYQIGITQAEQAVLQAQAQVQAAQQNYLKIKGGSRPQQVLQAQNTVAQTKANLDNARTILNRNRTLYQEGALAKADLDTAQTNYDVLVQQYRNTQQALSLTVQGNQREDIAAALAQVRQQQAALTNAIGNRKQVALRRDDILAAQAGIAQAQAALAFSQQQVANTYIRSPIDGIVASRLTEPGQIASPGTPLMRIVNVQTVYYEPTISETDFASTSIGDPVQIQVDAFPGKTFSGRIKAIYPAAVSGNRVFSLRVTVPNPRNELRPGMFARGSIITRVDRNVVLVPATALVPLASAQGFTPNNSSDQSISDGTQAQPQQLVVVGPGNRAQPRPVKVGIATMERAEILSGISPGEQIVVVGQQGLRAGDKLAIVNQAGEHGGKALQSAQATP